MAADFRAACNTASLCSGVQPGGGRIIQCLREHKSEVSTKCKIALGEFFLSRTPRPPKGGGAPGAGGGAGRGEQGPPPEGAGGGEEPPGK